MSIRTGNADQAREEIAAALELKRNYTAALYTLAQLDISQGNVATAIDTTEAIITLEPNNPTRYYQLGILLSADEQSEAALSAYRAAIALDRQYANARYLLALELINLNQTDAALEQLRVVQETNPENQELQALISQLEAGEDVSTPDLGLETPVAETEPEAGFEDAVISDGVLETDLVTPVNTVPETSEEETEAPADVSSRTESAGSTTTEETESTPDE
jgi:tetratricopeptide (TPR) repeat protein